MRAQDRHEWEFGWRPALADKRVLLVGYGAIGRGDRGRLLPFEVEVVRVARSARDGVHAIDELPELLPDADVVVLARAAHRRDPRPGRRGFLARMKDGALLVNVARGAVVDTDALVAALRTGRISAAVDVADREPLPGRPPALDRAQPADLARTSAAPAARCGRAPTGWSATSCTASPPASHWRT